MSNFDIYHWLSIQTKKNPDAIAIHAPGRQPLTYKSLLSQVEQVVAKLNAIGIGRTDRVALVLPNGPETAVAFLAVASCATCAPLNPAYLAGEFDFYLSDLNAKALIVQKDFAEAARTVAKERNIPIIELTPILTAEAGLFTLTGGEPQHAGNKGFAQADDVALVLHTSGTTSRPKIVPLTHTNLLTSAQTISQTLALSQSDRCLNVMPLFHIHGLVAVLLSSLNVSASVVCTPGFDAPKFLDYLEEFQPTWYSAVPTMHQMILEKAKTNPAKMSNIQSLRFIRSSSASLPPQVMDELEQVFNAPVIEAYGMTEAAHQMASNPLPPGQRKPGSVGLAAGPKVIILNDVGNILSLGEVGEVAIQGANVTQGYENNPLANQTAFTKGWFRTGDLGYLDGDNYLFLKGRIKEIINRGGEKISPREVDEVLLDHPAIKQVVTFAASHTLLGEDVAVAVILKEGASTTEQEIKEFATKRLADFKVPRVVLFLDKIPTGPTGKLQRIGLAEKLGLTPIDPATEAKSEYKEPVTPLEEKLVKIWSEVLQVEPIGIDDNFFALGGYSLLATQVLSQMEKAFNKSFPLSTIFLAPTIKELAKVVSSQVELPSWYSLVPIQPQGSRPPLFGIHFLVYQELSNCLGLEQPFYGLRYGIGGPVDTELSLPKLENLATHYIEEMRSLQPDGPYFLVGYSFGGVIAYEMARQLVAQGQQVGLLALIDTYLEKNKILFPIHKRIYNVLNFVFLDIWEKNKSTIKKLYRTSKLRPTQIWEKIKLQVSTKLKSSNQPVFPDSYFAHIDTGHLHQTLLRQSYSPGSYSGKVIFYKANSFIEFSPSFILNPYDMSWMQFKNGELGIDRVPGIYHNYEAPERAWLNLVDMDLEINPVSGDHYTVLNDPIIAEKLKADIDKALSKTYSKLESAMPCMQTIKSSARKD